MTRAFRLALCLLLGGCGATDVSLAYAPTVAVAPAGPPRIGRVVVSDARGEDGHYLGTIRGGYGNPLKTIRTADLVSDEVGAVFRQALAARGLLDPSGTAPDTLEIRITRMDANQYSRREAHADFALAVTDRTGQPVYRDSVAAQEINGSIVTFDKGPFASPDDLRAIMARTIDEAVDQALAKPALAAALARS